MAKKKPVDAQTEAKVDVKFHDGIAYVSLNKVLDFITENVYDSGHGFLYPEPNWTLDAVAILDELRDLAGLSEEGMAAAFDQARVRVHGPNVKGGRGRA